MTASRAQPPNSAARPPRPEPLAIEACGVRWRIDLAPLYPDNAALADKLRHLWARAAVEIDGTEMDFAILLPGDQVPVDDNGMPRGATLRDPEAFPYVLSRALTAACVSVRRGSALLLHAAGLTVEPGVRTTAATPMTPQPPAAPTPALVLIAASGTGKSTAVRTLGRRYGYLSDETVVVEDDLTISAYPKPVSLHALDRPGDKDEFSPDDLGLALSGPARVGATVLLDRDEAATEPALTRMSLADAMLAALPQTSSIHTQDRPLAMLAEVLTAGGGPYALRYADIENGAAILDSLAARLTTGDGGGPEPADAAPPIAPSWVAHTPPSDDRWHPPLPAPTPAAADDDPDQPADEADPGGSGPISMPLAQRAPWSDAVETGAEVVLLMGNQPLRLSGIGATIWMAAATPTPLATFIDRTIAAHGHHPYERTKTAIAVEELLEAGVLFRPHG